MSPEQNTALADLLRRAIENNKVDLTQVQQQRAGPLTLASSAKRGRRKDGTSRTAPTHHGL